MAENKNCESCEAKKYATEILGYYLTLEKELDYSGSAIKNFWKIYIRLLWYPDKQPSHVSKEEAAFICELREHGFSIGDIAEIVKRSKATVSEWLSRKH
jgi:hypothetical protein